jgi:surfeit locus 1 family protein
VSAATARGRPILLLALVAVAFAVLVALGTWQVQRLHWKEALIGHVTERLAAAPEPLPPAEDWSALAPEDYEFRKVVLRGTFLNDQELHVSIALTQPHGPIGGFGYFVVTPLVLENGDGVVLVNRGFVPLDRKDPATRAEGQPAGVVEIVGLMRPPDEGNLFTPATDRDRNIWFARDPAMMAGALSLGDARVAPFTVDDMATAPGGLPQGGETVIAFPNSHLQYAVTWYGLAAALLAVTVAYFWSRRKSAKL